MLKLMTQILITICLVLPILTMVLHFLMVGHASIMFGKQFTHYKVKKVLLKISKLLALGGNFTVSQLKRNYANFYALSSPVNITTQYFTNQQVHNEVVDFFKLLTMNGANMTCWEFVEAIVRALDGNFYMRRSTDYFQTKLHYPYFRLSWENVKL